MTDRTVSFHKATYVNGYTYVTILPLPRVDFTLELKFNLKVCT